MNEKEIRAKIEEMQREIGYLEAQIYDCLDDLHKLKEEKE